MSAMTIDRMNLPGAALAYLGDSVLEVLTRTYLLSLGETNPGKLNRLALDFVKAVNQSAGVEKILPLLTAQEEAVYRRGRNAHGISAPKSATVQEYRRATGLEALFAYLYLGGETERMQVLFRTAFDLCGEDMAEVPMRLNE